MSTLEDVYTANAAVKAAEALFGAEASFMQEHGRRIRALGNAICEENGVTAVEARELPYNTPLGAESDRLLTELKEWLATQSDTFKALAANKL